ncbi:methyltransferase N6AMT1 [Anopheles aquasalis]|uniref:methyltransferase N6AMT1 n=1 Tax=Anopheles aquasalis TaxID=42839 RepID=UPI00215A6229|nr:methyltransferase N6AMT1 [Anopheles aquasalis]
METPIYKFEPADYDLVYEPAEDTFLLLDALEEELEDIKARRPMVCVEVGPGSGLIITAIRKSLLHAPLCLGVDINPAACRMTLKTSSLNAAPVDAVNMDLLAGLRPHCVDLLVFNPPYVPTGEVEGSLEEHVDEFRSGQNESGTPAPIIHSWAGGADGRVVTDRLLGDLERILAPDGVLYLLLLKENRPADVLRWMGDRGFRGTIIKERRIRGEHLFVLRIDSPRGKGKSDKEID